MRDEARKIERKGRPKNADPHARAKRCLPQPTQPPQPTPHSRPPDSATGPSDVKPALVAGFLFARLIDLSGRYGPRAG